MNYIKQTFDDFKAKVASGGYSTKTKALRVLSHRYKAHMKEGTKLITEYFDNISTVPARKLVTRPRRVRTTRREAALIAKRAPKVNHEVTTQHRLRGFLEWANAEGMTLQEVIDFMHSF